MILKTVNQLSLRERVLQEQRDGILNARLPVGTRLLHAPSSDIVSVRSFNRNFPRHLGTYHDQVNQVWFIFFHGLRQGIRKGMLLLYPMESLRVVWEEHSLAGALGTRYEALSHPLYKKKNLTSVNLSSPVTAVVTALRSVISAPRGLGEELALPTAPPPVASVDDQHFLYPPTQTEAARVKLFHDPNVVPPPQQTPLPEKLSGLVLNVVGDDTSPTDLSPDGVIVKSFCSNVEAMANFVFRRLDTQFPVRAREWGGRVIVGWHNYGQTSSREHAILASQCPEVRAVIAKSFAHIHRSHLIAQSLVPLTFADGGRLHQRVAGDQLEIADLSGILEREEDEWRIRFVGTTAPGKLHFTRTVASACKWTSDLYSCHGMRNDESQVTQKG